jgi:hypothetical protein
MGGGANGVTRLQDAMIKAMEAMKEREEAGKKKEKPPLRFKDAVGRKFSFPFNLVQTWVVSLPQCRVPSRIDADESPQGMEELIKQELLHVEAIGPRVQDLLRTVT